MKCENCGSTNTSWKAEEEDTLFECKDCGIIIENGVEFFNGIDLVKAEENIYLTEQSLKELLEGKIIYDDDGRVRLYPPKTNELGIMKIKENK